MVLDQSGTLANMTRQDYLPFGEELVAPTADRTTAEGYVSGDGVRQHFTSKERDIETGLDYFINRYYTGIQGRFISPDEFTGGPQEIGVLGSGHPEKQALKYADVTNPQSLNKYQYCFNNPLRFTDPDGQNPQDSYELRLRRDEKALLEHKMTPEDFNARRRAEGVGALIGLTAVVTAAYGPEAATAILAWALRNPEAANQFANEAVQASSGNPTSPAQMTSAEVGLAREGAVAALTGGKVARQVVKVKGLGSTDIDVVGGAGEYIAVGGPAKIPSDVGRQLQRLKAAADQKGVKAMAYFAKGTPESVLKVARKWLGKENVKIFEDVK